MPSVRTHIARSMVTQGSAYEAMEYFHALPRDSALAYEFFDHWDALKNLRPGTFGSIQTALIMQRTGKAYTVHNRHETFHLGFRQELQAKRGRWLAHAQHSLPHSEIKELQQIMQGYGSVGIQPAPDYYAKLAARATHLMHAADEVDIQNMLWAHAVLAMPVPDALLAALTKQMHKKLHSFSEDQASLVLWSLAALDSMRPGPACKAIAQTMLHYLDGLGPVRSTEYNIDELSQIRDACVWFDFQNRHAAPMHRAETTSLQEREFGSILKEAGIKLLSREFRTCASLDKRADFAVYHGNRIMRLEFDGPSHFIRDTNGNYVLDGKTRFQTALLLKCNMGPIVRVPYIAFEDALARQDALEPQRLHALFTDMAKGHINGEPVNAPAMQLRFTGNALRLQRLTS